MSLLCWMVFTCICFLIALIPAHKEPGDFSLVSFPGCLYGLAKIIASKLANRLISAEQSDKQEMKTLVPVTYDRD